MRLLIADDSALLREGLTRLVVEAGHEVVATASDVDGLTAALDSIDPPDVAVLDVRMPPTYTDEGSATCSRTASSTSMSCSTPSSASRPAGSPSIPTWSHSC